MSKTKNKLITVPVPSSSMERLRWVAARYNIPFMEKGHTYTPYSLLKFFLYPLRGLHIADPRKYITSAPSLIDYLNDKAPEERKLAPSIKSPADKAFNLANGVVRIYVYGSLSHSPETFTSSLTQRLTVPKFTASLFVKHVVRLLFKWALGNQKSLDANKKVMDAAYSVANEYFKDGREFINGEGLSYADIRTCVAFGPTLLAPEYGGGGLLPDISDTSESFRQQVLAYRDTPTGRYVLNVYKNHRNL